MDPNDVPKRLREAAFRYVGRYGTSQARCRRYLSDKLRKWELPVAPHQSQIDTLVADLVRLGLIDDAVFADGRVASGLRAGRGARRIAAQLSRDGITGAAVAERISEEDALAAARAYARRRRFGPELAGDEKRRAIAAMMRAGHGYGVCQAALSPDDADNA
jgi:regulatory protein